MHWLEAVFLGIVQGLTEFLPVSSSGHLVLFQNLLGFKEPELLFDVCLHVGTLAAVIVVFFPQVVSAAQGLLRFLGACASGKEAARAVWQKDPEARMALLIIIGTIPTGIIGMAFHKIAGELFSSPVPAGAMLLVTGVLLWATRKLESGDKDLPGMRPGHALAVGIIQGLAVMPGLSRSGSTIAAALFLGVDRELAARFSFLLSIPAILAALVLELLDAGAASRAAPSLLALGALTAAVTGYIALRWLLAIVRGGKLWWFAPYCWAVGSAALALHFIK